MTQGWLYMVDSQGALTRLAPSAPVSEDEMQLLVAKYPELISDGDGDLLLIQREQSIADSVEGAGRWSVDHLFVTREAVPVLVELKRASDTRIRREVVGQMLDYAANATAYWKAGRVAEAFAARVRAADQEPDIVLSEFIGKVDVGNFWEQIDTNFRDGRIKMVFVADEVPRELARIVEFLNEQMRADVRAVELRWFVGENGVRTLSPRIIGETERAIASKTATASLPPIDRSTWIVERLGEEKISAADAFIRAAEAAGAKVDVTQSQGSLFVQLTPSGEKPVYPFQLWPNMGGLIALNLSYLKSRAAFASDEARQKLYDDMTGVFGPLTTKTLTGFPGALLIKLNDQGVRLGFANLMKSIVSQANFPQRERKIPLDPYARSSLVPSNRAE